MHEFSTELPQGAEALEPLMHEGWISDVLHPIKSGKEATTWLCRAGRRAHANYVVGKVYKELSSRSFRNDSVYQQGRVITNSRVRRAFENKSSFGKEVQMFLWIQEEFETLKVLYDEGLDVPRPLVVKGRALLQDFIPDRPGSSTPAPTLAKADLSATDARRILKRALWNVEEMLACCCVHGDLSGHNALVTEVDGRPELVVIDFPQAIDPRFNTSARDLLERDLRNLIQAFRRFGADADAGAIANRLWQRFRYGDLG